MWLRRDPPNKEKLKLQMLAVTRVLLMLHMLRLLRWVARLLHSGVCEMPLLDRSQAEALAAEAR